MRKLALLAAIASAGVVATGAGAAGPERLTHPIQYTFYAPFMSGACGVPVTITIEGTAHITLLRNDAGLVVREHPSRWAAPGSRSRTGPRGGDVRLRIRRGFSSSEGHTAR